MDRRTLLGRMWDRQVTLTAASELAMRRSVSVPQKPPRPPQPPSGPQPTPPPDRITKVRGESSLSDRVTEERGESPDPRPWPPPLPPPPPPPPDRDGTTRTRGESIG